MGRRNRHHVVSRGYQRNFADGERILLVDKDTRTYWPVGARDAFVERDFSSWLRDDATWDDSLEDEWCRIEDTTLPVVRRIGTADEQASDRELVKPLLALHIARSYGFGLVHRRISRATGISVGQEAESDVRLRELFETQFGRPPFPSEIELYIEMRMAEITQRRTLLVDRMIYAYNWALTTFLAPLKFQVIRAPKGMEWVTGDSPVVVTDKKFFRFLSKGQIAMGDAQVAFMPLSRKVLVDAWKNVPPEPDTEVDKQGCQVINWLIWRNCHHHVACHPAASPSQLLAGTRLTPRPGAAVSGGSRPG